MNKSYKPRLAPAKLAEKFKIANKRLWLYSIAVILAALLIALPHIASAYIVAVVFLMFIFLAYAEAWNIMSGFTGYINFGYSVFAGTAGYTSAILIMDTGLWWPIGWVLGGVSASIVALILGSFMLRLRGSYFAIGMLAILIASPIIASSKYLSPITRGGYGFQFVQPVSTTMMYYAAFFIAVMCVFTAYKIITSGFGAKLLAIREDEEGASSIGINTTENKIKAFTISAFFAGLAAGPHFAFQNYIEPHSGFGLLLNIGPIVMVLLGGAGTLYGPVLGAVIVTFVEEFLWGTFTELYLTIYGVVIILLVVLMPGGIIEWLKSRGVLPKIRAI